LIRFHNSGAKISKFSLIFNTIGAPCGHLSPLKAKLRKAINRRENCIARAVEYSTSND
jgi:hypothetical protein